jgi:DNA repair protein RAD50
VSFIPKRDRANQRFPQNFERNVRERESAIREVAKTHNFAGYDYSPLEDAKIVEFVDKLHDLVRRAEADLRKLQVGGAS